MERYFRLNYNKAVRRIICLCIITALMLFNVHAEAALSSGSRQDIIALYNSNHLDEAYDLITKIIDDDRDYELWYLLANISQDRGDNTNAVFFLQKSILLNPKFDKAHYNLGNIYLEEKRFNMAISEYKQAFKYKKDFPYYYYNTGCAYLGLKDYKKAASYFKKAAGLKNDEADFYYNLAYAYKNLKKDKAMNKALEEYNKIKEKEI